MAHDLDNVPPLPKSRSGVNGCLIGCLVVALVCVVGAALVGYGLYRGAAGMLEATTETAPRELPPLALNEAEQAESSQKVAALKTALEQGGEQREFSLTGDDLNVLLRSDENIRALGESVYITIANGEVRGEVSLELSRIMPLSFFEGRYLNGSGTFDVSASSGRIFVFLESFRFKDQDAPEDFMAQLRTQNLAQDLANDPSMQAFFNKIDEIKVVEDRMIITLK